MSSPVPILDQSFYTSLQISTAPTAAVQTKRFLIEHDAHYEVHRLLAQDDARGANTPGSGYGVLISEQGGPAWSNDFVQTDLMFGPMANPGSRLLTPIVLPAAQTLNVSFKATGLTPVYNSLDMALLGIKRPFMTEAAYQLTRKRPYFMYVTPFGQDLAGTTGAELEFKVDRDGAFVVQNMVFVGAYNRASGTTWSELGAVRVQIRNMSQRGRPFYTDPVGLFQVFGQKSLWQGGNRVLSPMIFGREDVIRVSVTIDSTEASLAETWKNIQFGFEGYKVKG